MIDRIHLEDIKEEYIASRRVIFVNMTHDEFKDFEEENKTVNLIAYQELEDLFRDDVPGYILVVDSRVLPSDRIRNVEVVNSPSLLEYPWQKFTDDNEQYYITLKTSEDLSIIGVIVPRVLLSKPKMNIKIGGKV